MSTITKNDKLISLRMPEGIIEFAKQSAKKQGRTMSNYLRWLVIEQMDTTEYLLSSSANKAMLMKAIKQDKNSLGIVKTMEELELMANQ
jgi:predicted DNA-binding protein